MWLLQLSLVGFTFHIKLSPSLNSFSSIGARFQSGMVLFSGFVSRKSTNIKNKLIRVNQLDPRHPCSIYRPLMMLIRRMVADKKRF